MTDSAHGPRLLDEAQIEDVIGSTSPEEAYKKFCADISRGLPRLIHDAVLAEANRIRRTRGINGATGWQRYLHAVVLEVRWGQPGLRSTPVSAVTVHGSADADGALRLSVCVAAHF